MLFCSKLQPKNSCKTRLHARGVQKTHTIGDQKTLLLIRHQIRGVKKSKNNHFQSTNNERTKVQIINTFTTGVVIRNLIYRNPFNLYYKAQCRAYEFVRECVYMCVCVCVCLCVCVCVCVCVYLCVCVLQLLKNSWTYKHETWDN